MILDRLGIIGARIADARAARALAQRWSDARRADPRLAADLLALGGVVHAQGARLDPQSLAYDAGRRDLALELAALMGMTPDQINSLVRE